MQLRKDFWRCAIVGAPLDRVLTAGTLDGWPLHWVPGSEGLHYLADPFGLWRDGRLYLFAESFDYRDARGRIIVSIHDGDGRPAGQHVVLRERWHLSYPFVFEADGETWMLPEAYESGRLWLYRANAFPFGWERAAPIELGRVPLDATPFHDGERWWLFYAPASPAAARLTELHAATAERLDGPWHPYAGPVLVDPQGVRPGGTPVHHDGAWWLPVQSCVGGYGSALRLVRLDVLAPDRIVARVIGKLRAPATARPFVDGCHTLSAAGPVTLIDVKSSRLSLQGLAVRPLRALYRWKADPRVLPKERREPAA